MTTKRTTHRSTKGTKLYAKRKADQFTDIQTHKRASAADQRQTTVEEATRVLVREARVQVRLWGGYALVRPLEAAIRNLNTATRAAAKRKRARSVKP